MRACIGAGAPAQLGECFEIEVGRAGVVVVDWASDSPDAVDDCFQMVGIGRSHGLYTLCWCSCGHALAQVPLRSEECPRCEVGCGGVGVVNWVSDLPDALDDCFQMVGIGEFHGVYTLWWCSCWLASVQVPLRSLESVSGVKLVVGVWVWSIGPQTRQMQWMTAFRWSALVDPMACTLCGGVHAGMHGCRCPCVAWRAGLPALVEQPGLSWMAGSKSSRGTALRIPGTSTWTPWLMLMPQRHNAASLKDSVLRLAPARTAISRCKIHSMPGDSTLICSSPFAAAGAGRPL